MKPPDQRSYDKKFMRRALELARLGEGLTRPNPPVGAVLVQDGRVIAEGWHQQAGGPHAEVACLSQLRPHVNDLSDAILYVTLEPCSTVGRTPPCTDLILEKGIGRVVVSVKDLNPRHAGQGLRLLKDAGVKVVSGICAEEGRALIGPFEKMITQGLPYVVVKLAVTLDGRIADRTGASRWITGPAARDRVQAMRRRADAIMVGAGTVRADDPSLMPRPDHGRNPWRVIVGKDIPPASKVLTDEAAERTLVVEGDLKDLLKKLVEKHDVMQVLCEGGGKLAAALTEAGLVDEYAFFIAPKFMGSDGIASFARTDGLLADAQTMHLIGTEILGNDVLIRVKPEE